jgi:lactate permease
MALSTIAAAVPVVVLLAALAFFHMQAHLAAGLALVVGVVVASFVFGMPAEMAGKAAGLGIISGLFPIGWIVLNIIFLHRLTTINGSFKVLQNSISASPKIAACNCCWWPSASARSSKARPASARPWP